LEKQITRWRDAYDDWVQGRAGKDSALAVWKSETEKQLPKMPRNYQEAPPEELAKDLPGAPGASLRRAIHWQGLFAVRDAFPDARATMAVDILNPHHKDYYEGKGTPHDAENPVPVFFLTVAPGSRFIFSVEALPGRERLFRRIGDWKSLLDAAFDHACGWLGFGAKTAVGYGAMQLVVFREAETEQSKAVKQPEQKAMNPEERAIEVLREIYDRDKSAGRKEPGGELNNRRVELLRNAKNWESSELRRKAADLIDETLRWLPWAGNKQKVAERRNELEELRSR
jgi:CRISPR-associated protein Cmr6